MTLLEKTETPMRPGEFARRQILKAILEKDYGPGDNLPAERILAASLGVTRPTVRETLQGLSKEGWVTIAHGKPTKVNDYLAQGGLAVLSTLAGCGDYLTGDLVRHLLQFRTLLLPGIASLAAAANAPSLIAYLDRSPEGPGDAKAFALFDWGLQTRMAALAGNPVFRMIFNDFGPVFEVLGARYFQSAKACQSSLSYYQALKSALVRDPAQVGSLVEKAMAQAQTLWEEMQ